MNDKTKAIFFAQYIGQDMDGHGKNPYKKLWGVTGQKIWFEKYLQDDIYPSWRWIYKERLLLRSIEQLTESEREVFMILGNDNFDRYLEGMINTRMKVCQSDYLRSIGILLPFTYLDETNQPQTLTPAQIVELGWAKLKAVTEMQRTSRNQKYSQNYLGGYSMFTKKYYQF